MCPPPRSGRRPARPAPTATARAAPRRPSSRRGHGAACACPMAPAFLAWRPSSGANIPPVGVRVCIDVPYLDLAVTFYAALGLTVRRRGDGFAELEGAGVPVDLLVKPAGTKPASEAGARSYERHWTPVHLDFVVDALEPAVERAVA